MKGRRIIGARRIQIASSLALTNRSIAFKIFFFPEEGVSRFPSSSIECVEEREAHEVTLIYECARKSAVT